MWYSIGTAVCAVGAMMVTAGTGNGEPRRRVMLLFSNLRNIFGTSRLGCTVLCCFPGIPTPLDVLEQAGANWLSAT